MRFSYHADTDSLYVHFSESPGSDAVEVSEDVVADVDEQVRIGGLDIQYASRFDLSTLDVRGLPGLNVQHRAA